MPGIINITFVAGAGPSYTLSVDSSSGAGIDHHVVCGIEGVSYDGGIYRITSVPDSSTLVVEDDVETSPYGRPAEGPGQFYIPTINKGLSQQVTGAYYWAEAQRRDSRIIDASFGNSVPTSRAINNGTGISGGGDLSADRTLSVNQAALNPVYMSSGVASSGYVPTANGAGGIAWQAGGGGGGVSGPGSSTDHALPRWDGAGGDTLLNSGVTLSDTDAMVFPAAGRISKPGTGAWSEAFGLTASAAGDYATAVGYSASVGAWAGGAIAIGYDAIIGGDCLLSISIGYDSALSVGCEKSILIGSEASMTGTADRTVCIGFQAYATQSTAVAIGQAVHGEGQESVAVGGLAETRAIGAVSLGRSAISSSTSPYAIAIGYAAQARSGADRGIIIGRYSELRDNVSYGIGMGDNCFVWHDYGMCFGRSAVTTAANRATFGQIGSGYMMELQCGKGFACFGATPPSSQPAKISNPGDLGSALTAIAAIIDVLEGAGLSSSV